MQFYRQLLYIRGKSLSHKTKLPLFHLGILRNVNNFYKIVNIFQIYFLKIQQQKRVIKLPNYFHEYAILLHPNLSVLTVDRARSKGEKEWAPGGWEREAPF
jgi:hypothetical protein